MVEKHTIQPKENRIYYIESIFNSRYFAQEGIYLGTYCDYKGNEWAIITATPDIDSTVVRHVPQEEIYSSREAAVLKADQLNIYAGKI